MPRIQPVDFNSYDSYFRDGNSHMSAATPNCKEAVGTANYTSAAQSRSAQTLLMYNVRASPLIICGCPKWGLAHVWLRYGGAVQL
eukprot:1726991-Prymnesium_polylepis.1